MTEDEFYSWGDDLIAYLKDRYELNSWDITLVIEPDEKLHPANAAEVAVGEFYRSATIYVAESLFKTGDPKILGSVIEHEVQHVFLHPLDALRSIVMDVADERDRNLLHSEFRRTNERVRASLERLLSRLAVNT